MCGIAGICEFNGKAVSLDTISKMTDALFHRGPDDSGLYVSPKKNVALGHRRLSIIDLSPQGRQPMSNENNRIHVVFNGEIYNYVELKKELEVLGHEFSSDTDTEVIIHLYEELGPKCVEQLRGMFAFAIWDEDKQKLFIARDRLGKKPLYYTIQNNCIWFASEITALTRVDDFSNEINSKAIDCFFSLLYIPSPLSIYKGIHKLEPAHYLCMDNRGVKVNCYWSLKFEPKRIISLEEAKLLLQEKLTEAVKIRLRSDVPVGCMLSGGVDSSIIALLMAELSPNPIRTFSIAFDNDKFNEAPHAKQVARMCSSKHTEYLITPDAIDVLPKIVQHYGEPFGDSSALPTWYLAENLRREVKVSLAGDGGDELFAGYQWYVSAMIYRKLDALSPKILMKYLARFYEENKSRTGVTRKISKLANFLATNDRERFALLRLSLDSPTKKLLYSNDFLLKCTIIPKNIWPIVMEDVNPPVALIAI